MRFVIFVLVFQVGNIFAQTLKGDNYLVQPLDKDCKCGYYLSKYYDPPNPFSPSSWDLDIQFGLTDFSSIEINIFQENKDTLVKISNHLPKGCYQLHWFEYQNFDSLKSGWYYCSFVATQNRSLISSTYSAVQKFALTK